MATGRVKWFNDAKGYGFIADDDGGPDLFVHYTGIAGHGHRSLKTGAHVRFDVHEGPKGLEAFDVRPIDAPVRPTPAERPDRPHEHVVLTRQYGGR